MEEYQYTEMMMIIGGISPGQDITVKPIRLELA